MNKMLALLFIILLSLIVASFLYLSSKLYLKKASKPLTGNPSQSETYKNISVDALNNLMESNTDIYLLDVHIPEQRHISGTDAFIPYIQINQSEKQLPKDKNTKIIVYCRSGSMSEVASKALIDLGYKDVSNVVGGLNAWKTKGYSL